MRTIGVVTVARSDYGIYLPILRQIRTARELELFLVVSGMHLSPEFGFTVGAIEADGFEVDERVEMLLSSDTPEGIAKSIGLGIIGFAQTFARRKPDILLVLGDRFEMLAAVAAALPLKIPIAHIHGGEITEGAIDDCIRHALTKMSHLHFVATESCRNRVLQMGEESWRVTVSGAPALDNLREMDLLSIEETERQIGFPLRPAPLLVTFHPVTLEFEETSAHIEELLRALELAKLPVLFTYPNADTSGRLIIERVRDYVGRHPNSHLAANLGTRLYFSTMKFAAAMVGNSSSGIVEAASLRLPVVNVGNRQKGREHGSNVIDVPCKCSEILKAIRDAIHPDFRATFTGADNPYGTGSAAATVVRQLREICLGGSLLNKSFQCFPSGGLS